MAKRNRKSLQQVRKNKRNKKKATVPVPAMVAVEEPAAVVVKKEGEKKMIFTKEDVAKHYYERDAWIIVNGNVYDCTKYLELNIGSCIDHIILANAGDDATEDFVAMYSGTLGKATKMLERFYIGELQPTSTVAAIIPVRAIGIVYEMSDMMKLLGSEQQLVVCSRWFLPRQQSIKLSKDVVNRIVTENLYNLRRSTLNISQPWIQMMVSLKSIDIDADNDTARTLIRSTNSFPNLKSITMRQPTVRQQLGINRYIGVELDGWVSLWDSLVDDDNVCVKINPTLKRIRIFPGVLAEERNLVALKFFVEINSGIEHMNVVSHECYENRFYEGNDTIAHQPEDIVLSIVNALAKNRASAIKKRAMEGSPIPSFMLEKVFSDNCYINVFDKDQSLYSRGMRTVRKADSMRPMFNTIRYFATTRTFAASRNVDEASPVANADEATILANVDEANVDEANVVNESAVLTDAAILDNIANFKADFMADADAE